MSIWRKKTLYKIGMNAIFLVELTSPLNLHIWYLTSAYGEDELDYLFLSTVLGRFRSIIIWVLGGSLSKI